MIVFDASMAVAAMLPESATAHARRVRAAVAAEGGLVPAGWPGEVANAMLVAERRGRVTRLETSRLLAILAQEPITVDTLTS